MTRTEMRTQLQLAGFNDQSSTTLDAWIDAAYFELMAVTRKWPWLQDAPTDVSISAGAYSGSLAATVNRVESVHVKSGSQAGYELQELSNDMFVDYFNADRTATDEVPSYYTLWEDGTLRVYPAPSQALTLEVWGRATEESSFVTTPPFPARHHEILVYGALKRAYERFDDMEKLSNVIAEWEKRLERMETDLVSKDQEYVENLSEPETYG